MTVRVLVFLACFIVPAGVMAQGTKSPQPSAQQAGQTKATTTRAPDTKATTKAPDTKATTQAPDTKATTRAPDTRATTTSASDARATQQGKSPPANTKARPGNTRPLPGNTRPIPPRPDATKGRAAQSTRPAITVAPEADPRVAIAPIMREAYDYDAGGRRDPFLSLLNSEDLRPMISDLRLVSILYDESGRRPIAVMRDVQNNTQYRVTTGSTLGRLKVALIKRKAVIFSIEEFGLNRQDSLVLGDTTKARTR